MLVTRETPVRRAKFLFIDIHAIRTPRRRTAVQTIGGCEHTDQIAT